MKVILLSLAVFASAALGQRITGSDGGSERALIQSVSRATAHASSLMSCCPSLVLAECVQSCYQISTAVTRACLPSLCSGSAQGRVSGRLGCCLPISMPLQRAQCEDNGKLTAYWLYHLSVRVSLQQSAATSPTPASSRWVSRAQPRQGGQTPPYTPAN